MIKKFMCCFTKNKNLLHEKEENINIKYEDTIQFIPPIDEGIVIKVYDGDTITIASKLPYENSRLYRFSVRLNGIDCPEIKGETEEEKECAQIAKNILSNLILNKKVKIKNKKTEKYGRILADIFIEINGNNLHINQFMLDENLAVIYDGKQKKSPKNWLKYYKENIKK